MWYLIEDKRVSPRRDLRQRYRTAERKENFISNDRFPGNAGNGFSVSRTESCLSFTANEFTLLWNRTEHGSLSLSLSFSALIIKLPVFVWKVLLPRDNTWMLFECSRLSPAFPPKEWCNLADAFSYLSYLSAGRGTIYNRGN